MLHIHIDTIDYIQEVFYVKKKLYTKKINNLLQCVQSLDHDWYNKKLLQ